MKGFGTVIFRRTYPEIKNEGSLWDTSAQIYPLIGGEAVESALMWKFKSGTSIKFAHLQHEKDKYDWQGSQIPLIEMDELTHFTESQFFYLMSRNRSTCGVKPYIRATCNPDADSWVARFIDWWIGEDGLAIPERSGMLRWFIRLNDELIWSDTKQELLTTYPDTFPKSLTFILAKLEDNKILEAADPGYRANLNALTLVERERLLGANWKIRASAGMYFKTEWFEITDYVPKTARRHRHWDLAATEPSADNPDPDWTVGLLLAEENGVFYVEDVQRFRKKPAGVEAHVLQTAEIDGKRTSITIEQEPGSSGKNTVDHYARNVLQGYTVRGQGTGGKNKEARASPTSSAAENGIIKVKRAEWNHAFLSELEGFPEAAHDDQVDGLTGCHFAMTSSNSSRFQNMKSR